MKNPGQPVPLHPSARRTEMRDPRYATMGTLAHRDSIRLQFNAQLEAQQAALLAVDALANAAEAAVKALRGSTGRIVYIGAGTSGRLGIQDGVELTPTFNWPRERCVYLMAGGLGAAFRSQEGAEDNGPEAVRRIRRLKLTPHDVVIGIAASGTTPFALAGVREARRAGAVTIAITNNRDVPLLQAAQYPVYIESGSEVIAGSTRLKAGSMQKNALNALSNEIMIGLGNVYDGMMINMQVTCDKLYNRALGMIRSISGCDDDTASEALFLNGNRLRPAILYGFGIQPQQAEELLARYDDHLPDLLRALRLDEGSRSLANKNDWLLRAERA